MSKRLFSYPPEAEAEADGVKKTLEDNGIEFYETPASRWGFSQPAIWIRHDSDFSSAKALFDAFQQEFAKSARQRYQEETGYDPSAPMWQRFTWALSRAA